MRERLRRLALNSWSVSGKISFGFAIVLLLHGSIAVIAHYGLDKADGDRRQQDRLRAQVGMFEDIDRTVGELQRNVLLFAYAGVRGPELRVEDLQKKLAAILDQAKNNGDDFEGGRFAKMREHLHTHREIFDAVVDDRAKRRQLLDVDMVQYVAKFERHLDLLRGKLVAHPENSTLSSFAKVSESFQAARLQAMQFVHSPDSSHVRELKRELGVTRDTLASIQIDSGELDAECTKALRILKDYEASCIQMVQATRGYLHLTNVVLAGESKELSYLAGQARRDCSMRADQLSKRMAVDSASFSQASTWFSLITIVMGCIASWAIQRSISPGLDAITATFDGLARGERITSIPGKERRDELGRMAAAAQVFRDKAALTEELLEGVRELRERDRVHAHSQKLESLGQLAAGIAHEINTPLQCVAANVEFLEDSYEVLIDIVEQCCGVVDVAGSEGDYGLEQKALIETLRKTVKSRRFEHVRSQTPMAASEAADAVRRVVEIIVATKSLTHPGSVDLIECDLNQLIQHSATLSRNHWREVAEVRFELTEDLPSVRLQPAELSQVMINLIVNASDAIAQQDSDLSRKGEIVLRSCVEEGFVRIEVQDNGPGIPDDVRNRIFDPFFTTKDVGKGTGQGLAISYNIIVNRLHGQIDVDTTVREGTCFWVRLPLSSTAAPKEELLKTV